jgi:hypothetical protein
MKEIEWTRRARQDFVMVLAWLLARSSDGGPPTNGKPFGENFRYEQQAYH